jgi:Domain of unknown function (DUF4389)
MAAGDYPADFRADYPQRSSRGWAVLTILVIKLIALLPHVIVLIFLGIAQWVVAFIAQFVVAFKGEYPAGMHEFVTGVLRWGTRVASFALSLTDKYPPFSLKPLDDYPVDIVVQRPSEPSRMYAVFTIVVQILVFIGMGLFAVWAIRNADAVASWASTDGSRWNYPSSAGSGLLLRQLAAIPHYIVLVFLGIAAFFIWVIVQWVILFIARFPAGLYDVMEGYMRWTTRVNAYALGLIDRYPPFTLSSSLTAQAPPAPPPAAPAPAAPPPSAARPAPPPPAAPLESPSPTSTPGPEAPPPGAPSRPPAVPETPAPPREPPPPEAPRQP